MLKKILGVALGLAMFAAPAFAAGDTIPSGHGPDNFVFGSDVWYVNHEPDVFKTASATVITSETTLWTPATGKKFRLLGYCISEGVVTGAVTLKDNTAGTTILVIPQQTVGVMQCASLGKIGILSAAANNVLTATGVSTETITGYFYGTEE